MGPRWAVRECESERFQLMKIPKVFISSDPKCTVNEFCPMCLCVMPMTIGIVISDDIRLAARCMCGCITEEDDGILSGMNRFVDRNTSDDWDE